MKYVIEFDLPDNDTVLNNIKTAWVGWNVWGYSGIAHAKPKQPERKTGKWIKDRLVSTNGGTYGVYRCSLCEHSCQDIGYGYNFCPNCGAKMEEGEQDAWTENI